MTGLLISESKHLHCASPVQTAVMHQTVNVCISMIGGSSCALIYISDLRRDVSRCVRSTRKLPG